MRAKQSLVGYAQNYLKKSKDFSEFVPYLVRFPELSKEERNPWSAIGRLVDELSSGPRKTRTYFESRLNDLISYYCQLCREQRAKYLAVPDAAQITAQIIFRLRKCIPIESKLIFEPTLINELLALLTLPEASADPQALCNGLLGAGYLAVDGHLKTEVLSSEVNAILNLLMKQAEAADEKYLCNVLLGLGYLALQKQLQAGVSTTLVNQMLNRLLEKSSSLQIWHFGNALLGVGYLTQQGRLLGKLNRTMVNAMLGEVAKKCDFEKFEDIINVLIGASNIALQHCQVGDVMWQNVEMLFTPLIEKRLIQDPKKLCQVILGVSHLALCCKIWMGVKQLNVNAAFAVLADQSHIEAGDLVEALIGLRILTTNNLIIQKLDVKFLNQIVSKVDFQNTRIVVGLLIGILMEMGCLGRLRCLEGAIDARVIQILLSSLYDREKMTQPMDLPNALNVVVDIVRHTMISGKISGEIINQILGALAKTWPIVPACHCSVLLAANELFQVGCLEGKLNATVVNSLLATLVEYRKSINPAQLGGVLKSVSSSVKRSLFEGEVDFKLILALMASPSQEQPRKIVKQSDESEVISVVPSSPLAVRERSSVAVAIDPAAAFVSVSAIVAPVPPPAAIAVSAASPVPADVPALAHPAAPTTVSASVPVASASPALAPAFAPAPEERPVIKSRKKKKSGNNKQPKNKQSGQKFFEGKNAEEINQQKKGGCCCQWFGDYVKRKLGLW